MRRDHRPAHAIFGRGGAVRATSPALSQCARDAVAAVSRSFSAEVIVVGARDGIGNDAAYPQPPRLRSIRAGDKSAATADALYLDDRS